MRASRPGRTTLSFERIAVVSPHLDDGIFSLGAAIAQAARGGAEVTVVTVFAGDPGSEVPAGAWDRRCGFTTAGEALRARRLEDEHACALVGARPVWLPYADEQYPRGGDGASIWNALVDAVGPADAVLAPGSPLKHDDHRWLTALLTERRPPEGRLGLYVEEPYTAHLRAYRDRALPGTPLTLEASPRDWVAKARACRAYRSQLPLFGRAPVTRVLAYELRKGGERIAWID